MNEKMVAVIQQMLDHPELISSIYKREREIYFIYKGHFFSALRIAEDYWLYIYPNWSKSLEELANDPNVDFSSVGESLDEVERFSVLRSLYKVLNNTYLGIDKVLDDILATA